MTESVWHNRTVTVAKSRNAEAGLPLAFNFGKSGAVFEELGFIAPKSRATVESGENIRLPYADGGEDA